MIKRSNISVSVGQNNTLTKYAVTIVTYRNGCCCHPPSNTSEKTT